MAQSKIAQRIGIAIIVLLWLLAIWALMTLILKCSGPKPIEPPAQYRQAIDDPGAEFAQITGLGWPTSAKIVTVADTHGGFLGDGEFYLVFSADQETLKEWLSTPPPWEMDEWKSGPVPPEIGCNASFGIGSVGIGKVGNGPYKYWGDEQLINLLDSDKILFVANERCCGRNSLYFHNGELLIIDVDSQKVWFSSWDY